jgi:hypothetical protein
MFIGQITDFLGLFVSDEQGMVLYQRCLELGEAEDDLIDLLPCHQDRSGGKRICINQGTLTEREDSVQLTSSFRLLVL